MKEEGDDLLDTDDEKLKPKLQGFDFQNMRNLGQDACGFKSDVPPHKIGNKNFVKDGVGSKKKANEGECTNVKIDRKLYSCNDVIRIIIGKKTPKRKKLLWENDKETKRITVQDADGSVRSIREWAKAAFKHDAKQRRAFEVITASFVLTFYEESKDSDGELDPATRQHVRRTHSKMKTRLRKLQGYNAEDPNLICLLHGPGGSGKSTVINTVKAYASDYCSKLKHDFDNRTMIVTAMSGVAATLINGETTHSVLGLNRTNVDGSDALAWKDARLLIVDECSFASARDFEKMHQNLKILMGDQFSKYGGINIVFSGDFSQLEPVQREPVYKNDQQCPEFHGSLNCYIELDGRWRFVSDKRYGEIMYRFRSGTLTEEDIERINNRVGIEPPEKTQVASYTNRDRDAINAAIFDRITRRNKPRDGTMLRSACMILMDDIYMNDSRNKYVPVLSNGVLKYFYENCTEDECSQNKKRAKDALTRF